MPMDLKSETQVYSIGKERYCKLTRARTLETKKLLFYEYGENVFIVNVNVCN